MKTLKVTDIHRVLVIGSGTMGLQIGTPPTSAWLPGGALTIA